MVLGMSAAPQLMVANKGQEESLTYDIADVVQHLEFTVRSCTLGMDDSFRDPLAVKMREEID